MCHAIRRSKIVPKYVKEDTKQKAEKKDKYDHGQIHYDFPDKGMLIDADCQVIFMHSTLLSAK
jgi:hypothetical protein